MKIASIVKDLTLSDNNFYMTKNFNKLTLNDFDNSVFSFYLNLSSVGTYPNFSVMNACYADFLQNGIIIASSLETLRYLLNIKTNSKKYYYVWDLEWLRDSLNYMENVTLLRDKNIKLLARSESHAENISNYCNRPVDKILDNWNVEGLKEL